MAWREKVAWITLVAMAAAYGGYFTLIGRSSLSAISMLEVFMTVTVIQVVAVIVVTAVWAGLSGADARARPDERDRAIARRGAGIAYFVLMVGVIATAFIMPFGEWGWGIGNTALVALVCAEAVRQFVVVFSYRRGWHG